MAREKTFRFKHFNVVNDKSAMKVGTDGVLIGAWCDVASAQRILDVGTGCGLISLMIAQRNSYASILGIDIDENAVEEASANFSKSPWSNRLSAMHADFNEYHDAIPLDLIVSNPPFFSNGVEAPGRQRNIARHATTLSLEQLITHSCHLLTVNGVLAIITPADVENEIRRSVVKCNMSIKRIARVVTVEGGQPKRLMWELVKGNSITQTEDLIIRTADNSYTQQYLNLTREFYLNR